jgi:hypothetical protein
VIQCPGLGKYKGAESKPVFRVSYTTSSEASALQWFPPRFVLQEEAGRTFKREEVKEVAGETRLEGDEDRGRQEWRDWREILLFTKQEWGQAGGRQGWRERRDEESVPESHCD